MAEDILYEQIDGGGDPDPLGLRKKLAGMKSGNRADPLGLRAKLSPSETQQPKAFEIKISQLGFSQPTSLTQEGTVISDGGNVGTRDFSYEKQVHPLAAIKNISEKAQAAHENLNKELAGNKDVKISMIKQRRFDEAARNVELSKSDMPKTQPQIDVERLMPQAIKPQDLPVTDDDLIKEDQDVQADRGKAVRLLEETMKTRPERAKEIQKNVYLVDAYNSLNKTEKPEDRIPKIEANAKRIEKGEVVYDPRSEHLVRPLGMIGSAVEGWKQKSQLFADYDLLKSGDDASVAAELEKRRTKFDPDEPIALPKGKLAEAMQMLGGTPIKPIAGGALASFFGTPLAGATAGAAIGGMEFAKLEYAANFQQVYNELREQGVDQAEAVQEARRQAQHAAVVGGVMGVAMGAIGGRIATKPFGSLSMGTGFRQAAFNVLKSIGNDLGRAGLEGLAVGGIGAAGQVYKNKLAQAAGINRETDAGVLEQIEGNLLATVAMAAAIKAGKGITKPNYRKLLHGLSKMSDDQISSMLEEKVNNGEITQAAADETQTRITDYKGLDKLIPDNVTEDARFKIQDKIKRRQDLEQRLENTDKAYHPEIKEKIKTIDEEIVNLTKENKEQVQKSVSGLPKPQEKEAIEFADELINEGVVNDLDAGMAKTDPIGFFKMIAQQAQGRDQNWRPLSEGIPEQAVRDQFGDTVVDYATELFPAPELPKSGVSVIMPGEIKQPETITITPKETVPIPERVPNAVNKVFEKTIGLAGKNGFNTEVNKTYRVTQQSQIDDIIDVGYIRPPKGKMRGGKEGEVHWAKGNENLKYTEGDGKYILETDKVSDQQKGALPFEDLTAIWKFNRDNSLWENILPIIKEQIKSKKSAIPVPISNEVSIRSSSKDGGTMGQGDTQSEITTGTQEGIGQPQEKIAPESEEKPVSIHAEHPPTQISFRGLQEVANEFGYDDVKSRDRVSDIQERKNADITVNEWAEKGDYQKNIDDLLTRVEKREHVPTAKQRLMLEQYLANERQTLRDIPKNSSEYDTQLAKVRRIKDIGQIARQEAGAALRLPNDGTLPHPIVDEESAMIAKMEANGVDVLTDQQKAQVEAQVSKYKGAAEEANAKVAKLEEQVSKIEAEKELKKLKSTTKKTKKSAEERANYRQSQIEAAREALKKLRTGESGLSAVPLPGVRELMAIAPHVKNIMVDLVSQGVDNLQELVANIHSEFKDVYDGLTEKNVHDIIAGEYNEKKEPLSDLRVKIRDLQDEAKLINQLEALENGAPPKSERAKRERNQKIKELRDKIKELKAGDGADQLRAIKKRNEEQAKKIRDKIEKGDFEKEVKKSIFDREDVKSRHPELRKEALDAIAAKEDAQHEFDLALLKDKMEKRSAIEKAADFAGKLIHTSKAVAAGIDDSATFIQNGLAMLANPKTGLKVWLEHWKDAFSDQRFKRELAAIHERPDWEIIKKSGLDITEPSSSAGEKVEELFEQNLLAGKIKIGGKDFEPWKNTGGIFERAFTSMGNNMRLALFEKRMQMLIDEGKTYESHPEEYKAAARVVNELTGRGKLPEGVAQAAPWITPFIWAPRMLTASINTLGLSDLVMGAKGKGYYQNLTPTQRKFALGQLGRGIGIGVAVMGAASLAGAEVDSDPRSVTFGDVIFGDHHYNVFGRFTPVVKAVVQVATGTRTIKGQEQDLDKAKMGGKTRMGIVGGFFRGKMTPAAGAGYDLLEGKNYYTKEEFGVKDVPEALLTPMSVKDLIQGWKNDGTWSILNGFLPAFEGMKVSDERDFKKMKSSSSSGGGRIKRKINRSSSNKMKHL